MSLAAGILVYLTIGAVLAAVLVLKEAVPEEGEAAAIVLGLWPLALLFLTAVALAKGGRRVGDGVIWGVRWIRRVQEDRR